MHCEVKHFSKNKNKKKKNKTNVFTSFTLVERITKSLNFNGRVYLPNKKHTAKKTNRSSDDTT